MNPEQTENGTVVEPKENADQNGTPAANNAAGTKQVPPEKTIFGKMDDKIMESRAKKAKKKADKAAKKQAKAEQKAAKQASQDGKKVKWGTVAAVTAGVVGVVGTVFAVMEHNAANATMPNQTADLSGSQPCAEALPEPVKEPVPAETAAPTVSAESNSET